MKQIIPEYTEIRSISLRDALNNMHSTETIIAYETAKKTGLGVLVQYDGEWGFNYHRYSISDRWDLKYVSHGRKSAVKKALEAGRTVLMFDSFEEFLHHAVKMSKL